jgi:hypothetical protein
MIFMQRYVPVMPVVMPAAFPYGRPLLRALFMLLLAARLLRDSFFYAGCT